MLNKPAHGYYHLYLVKWTCFESHFWILKSSPVATQVRLKNNALYTGCIQPVDPFYIPFQSTSQGSPQSVHSSHKHSQSREQDSGTRLWNRLQLQLGPEL